MTAPVKQMRGCIWYLGSYTDQLSLPREGSDGKEPPQLPAEIRTAEKPDCTPHLSHSPPPKCCPTGEGLWRLGEFRCWPIFRLRPKSSSHPSASASYPTGTGSQCLNTLWELRGFTDHLSLTLHSDSNPCPIPKCHNVAPIMGTSNE